MHDSILVVSDEGQDIGDADGLCDFIAGYGLRPLRARDDAAMWHCLATERVDLVVFAFARHGEDTLARARALRRASSVPLVLVTPHARAADRIAGLDCGADDHVSGAVEVRELLARIRAVLRRTAAPALAAGVGPAEPVQFDGWHLDPRRRQLTAPTGTTHHLSEGELQLLRVLLRTPGRAVSREQLMAQVRGRPLKAAERSLDLLVSRLRNKFCDGGEAGAPIRTVRGKGYLLEARPLGLG